MKIKRKTRLKQWNRQKGWKTKCAENYKKEKNKTKIKRKNG